MTRPRTIDCHTHILTDETIGLLAKEAPWVAPKLTPIDDDFAVLEIAGTPYRPFPRGGWELERRFKDMDAAEVDVHVLSATPQTYLYDQDAAADGGDLGAAERPDRQAGEGASGPLHGDRDAADAGARARRRGADAAPCATLGMRGAMIGSNIAGKNLDDPSFEPVWATAAELGAFMIIHPGQRRRRRPAALVLSRTT